MRNGLVRIYSYEEVDPENPGHKEPCMNICRRAGGKGTRIVIPLMNLYEYWGTAGLAAKAVEFTSQLFGNPFSKSDLLIVGNLVDDGLDELFRMKPELEKTKFQVDQEIERLGIKFSINGETILDAS